MRSKDLAKAAGLAVVFDLTAHTFYRVSRNALAKVPAGKSPENKKKRFDHEALLFGSGTEN